MNAKTIDEIELFLVTHQIPVRISGYARPFSDVIEDLAYRWNSFSQEDKDEFANYFK